MPSTPQIDDAGAQSRLWPPLAAMRPEHWVKNLLLFVALFFSGEFINVSAWLACAAGFGAFCLLASAIYLLNDVYDRKADATHPTKRHRPIASGRLSVGAAMVQALVLAGAGAGVSAALGAGFAACAGGYVLLNVLYTYWLKHRAIIDVITLSLGFVVRAMASATAIGVPISAYLVVCTFMLCLFIALAKRRSEVNLVGASGDGGTRRVAPFYTPDRTEHMLSVSAGLSIVTYSLYCLAPTTVARLGSHHMVWTIPLVVYAMFRYYCLASQAGSEDPVRILLRDKVMWLVGLLWVALVVVVVEIGKLDQAAWLRDILI